METTIETFEQNDVPEAQVWETIKDYANDYIFAFDYDGSGGVNIRGVKGLVNPAP